jgi:redox-sensitive bicupin YhaK (pirin superfamily)
VRIHQDARIYAGLFDGAERASLDVDRQRRIYVHVARGALTANGNVLGPGDGLELTETAQLALSGGSGAEVLVFDLPGASAR